MFGSKADGVRAAPCAAHPFQSISSPSALGALEGAPLQ